MKFIANTKNGIISPVFLFSRHIIKMILIKEESRFGGDILKF
jgi:hypothetical protein